MSDVHDNFKNYRSQETSKNHRSYDKAQLTEALILAGFPNIVTILQPRARL